MWDKFDSIVEFIMGKIVMRIIPVFMIIVILGLLIFGVNVLWNYVYDKLSPSPISVNKIAIEIHPYYWSCTAVTYQEYQGGNIKTGHYTAHKCLCSKWEAHMVGKDHPADAQCPDGSRAEELNGIR